MKRSIIYISVFFWLALIPVTSVASTLDSLRTAMLQSNDDTQRMQLTGILANEYLVKWEMDSVKKYASLYFTQALELDHQEGLFGAYTLLSSYSDNISDLFSTLDYTYKALVIADQLNNPYFKGLSYNNMSWTYVQLGDHRAAVDAGLRSVKEFQQLSGTAEVRTSIGFAFNNVSIAYLELGLVDSALYFNHRAYANALEDGNIQLKCWALAQYGSIYQLQKKFAKSDSVFRRVLHLADSAGLYQVYVYATSDYALLLNSQERFKEAIQIGRRAWIKAQERRYRRYGIEVVQQLYLSYRSLGKVDSALHYAEAQIQMADGLYDEEQSSKINNLRFGRDIAQAEAIHQEALEGKAREVERERQVRNALLLGILLVMALTIFVVRQRNKVTREKRRSEALLLNILPAEIAEELKDKGESSARRFDEVTILFTDFKEFTQISEQLGAEELVSEINHCFKAFDEICERHQIEKIKTIGDSYMAAGGLPAPQADGAERVLNAALEMMEFVKERETQRAEQEHMAFRMRAGIHTGNVVAGIVGVKKFQYDVWGDSVNTASRMESHGESGRVNISQTTYERVKDLPGYAFEHRGKIQAKGKGAVDMYFVQRST